MTEHVQRLRVAKLRALLAGAAIVGTYPFFETEALAQAETPATAQTTPAGDIIVTGRSTATNAPGGGLLSVETAPKAVQTVSREYIAKQAPTINAQQMLSQLPSANVFDADPFGLQPGQSYVRGLDSSQTAWVLEGVPLNDIGSGSFFAAQYVEAEDLHSVSLQPGSVGIDTPTVNATAGQVLMQMEDPTHKFGGLIDGSLGSDNLRRGYIRLNTGDIGNTGIRGFLSYSYTKADNWVGPGDSYKHHIDSKFIKDFSDGSRAALVVAYNYEIANFYRQPTLAQYQLYGNHFTYDSKWQTGDSAYYKLQVNPFANVNVSAPLHWNASSKVTVDDTPYIYNGVGSGAFGVTVTQGSTFAGNQRVAVDLGIPVGKSIVAEQIGQNNQFRAGNTLSVKYHLSNDNVLTAGWWYQHAAQHYYSRIGMVNQNTGAPMDYWGNSDYYTYNNGTPYDWRDFRNHASVNVLFIQDAADFLDKKIHVEAGFKYAIISSRVSSLVPGLNPEQKLVTRKPLPQFAISWQPDDENQVYATVATNFRTPSANSLVNLYSRVTGAQTQASGPSSAEYSVSEELGYRYNGTVLVVSVSGFHYHFKNRQLALNEILDGAQIAQTINAGSQETWGIDAQLGTRPIFFHLRPYLTFEYLHARIESNLPVTSTLGGITISDFLPTRGKTQLASPDEQVGGGLDYDDGHLFANFQAKYITRQYSTFMNDQSIPAYITTRMSLGYRFHALGFFKAPQLQVNLTNLANSTKRTGVYTFQTNAKATTGLMGGQVAASNPTYYLLPSRSVAVTLSTSF